MGQEFRSEFFWLCPLCSSTLKLASDDNGEPLLVPCGSKKEGDRRRSRIRRVFGGVLPECVVAELPRAAVIKSSGPSVTVGS